MGFVIHRFEVPAFLVTLGGVFFARGLSFVVSRESVGITHPLYQQISDFGLPMPGGAALPAWVAFMRQALASRLAPDFHAPPLVELARIDPASGALTQHGQPIRLPTRPIHMTTDIPS